MYISVIAIKLNSKKSMGENFLRITFKLEIVDTFI